MPMKLTGRTYWCFAHQMRFLIGCSLGITLSLIVMPLIEEHCMWYGTEGYKNEIFTVQASAGRYAENADDYEPVLNLNGKPKKTVGVQKFQVTRPRYYSTELNIREKLFVAVLTSATTILTLGSALNRTLSKHTDKIVFFIQGAEPPKIADSSLVTFADQRAVLVPFYMLQHIADNFLHDYDFFFFAKDTTHIRGRKLNDFVHHISISLSVHVGENIEFDSLYCSLDAGILLSNNILKKTVEDIDWCIQHAFSDSNSDNFGRCILHGTHQPCTSAVQGLKFVSHPLLKYDSLESSILKSSWTKDLKHTITLYSVSNPNDHYMIHNYFCQQELVDNQHKLLESQQKILEISHMLPNSSAKVPWPIGIEPPFKARNRFDVINWVYFNESHSFLSNEQTGLSHLNGLYKAEVNDIMKSAINWVQDQYEDRCIFQRLVNGYKRFDPTRGTEYVLDLVFLEDVTGKEFLKRIEAIRPLNEVEIIPVPFVTEHSRVILLLIVQLNERHGALHFLEDYAKNCLEKQDSTVLLLIFLYGPQDSDDAFNSVKSMINTLTSKYKPTGAKIAWLSMRTIGKVPPTFAIVDLVSRKLATDSMLLVCRVGMEIHSDYLNRVRMNTILKTQVFFPIPYVQYHPTLSYKHLSAPDNVEVKKDLGHFDHYSYDFASFYLSDYLNVRKLFENKVPVLHTDKDLKNELLYTLDFDVCDMFLKSNLHIMRAVEPDLRLRFTFEFCETESSPFAYDQCLEKMGNKLGSKSQLAAAILSHAEGDSNAESNVLRR